MEACSSYFLPRIVGRGRAMEWVLTGRTFLAKDVYNQHSLSLSFLLSLFKGNQ